MDIDKRFTKLLNKVPPKKTVDYSYIKGQKIKYKTQTLRWISIHQEKYIVDAIFIRYLDEEHCLVQDLTDNKYKSIFIDYIIK